MISRWFRSVAIAWSGLPRGLRWVLLLAAVLHGVGLSWGLPSSDAWDNDGIAPRDILPGLAATFTPGDHYTYPPLQLAILAVLTLPVTVLAAVRAGSSHVPVVIGEILKPPYMTTFTITARIVTFLMSLGIILAIAAIAAETAPRERRARVSTFAALFATVNWSFSYYAHTSNLDVPYLFWAWLAVLALVRAIVRHEPRRLRAFAVLAALAVATKDQAYAMFLLGAPAAFVAWAALVPAARADLRRLLREALIGLLIALGVLLLLSLIHI